MLCIDRSKEVTPALFVYLRMLFRIVLFRIVLAIGYWPSIKDQQIVNQEKAILLQQLEFTSVILKLSPKITFVRTG